MYKPKTTIILLTIASFILIMLGVLTFITVTKSTQAASQRNETLACILHVLSDSKVPVYNDLEIELSEEMRQVCNDVARARRRHIIDVD